MSHEFHELAIIGRRLTEPLTGVGRYTECLLRHWQTQDIPFETIKLYVPGEPQLPAEVLGGRVSVEIIPQKISPLYWENIQLPVHLKQADLIFAPYTLPWFSASRGVVSNLGIYESRPADFSLLARLRTTPFFRHSVRSAVRAIANSESTRRDLVQHYGAVRGLIDVVHLGADRRLSPAPPEQVGQLPEKLRKKYKLPNKPFFLLVGKLSKRRNIPLLIEAFAKANKALPEPHQLVLIGPDYLRLNPIAIAESEGVSGAVSHAPFAPMDDLKYLYRAATAFVLPTEHEGFSLTVPEAMASGAPAIVFDHAALEGPLRDAAWIVSPTSEAVADAMTQVATDAPLRNNLREQSIAAAQHYSWATTAQKTMQILTAAARALRKR